MTPQELKISILTKAIEGKLVNQIPEEGTGHFLYETIIKNHSSKKKIKENIVKRHNTPETWRWCQFDKICNIVVGATPSTSNPLYWDGNIPWLPSGVCQDCEVLDNDCHIKKITEVGLNSCSTKMMEPETVLIALTGATAGKVGFLRFSACANQSVVGIKSFNGEIYSKFIFYTLMARKREILSDCVGSAQPHISKDYVCRMSFALPPLEEQKRIVAKIEELLPLVDKYEEAWTKLEKFNSQFPNDMEKSILQYAIEGKLVEQNENDGNAIDLLNFIKNEKNDLIKRKIIKKDKNVKEISFKDIPFEIPNSWQWCRLRNICTKIVDGDHNPPSGLPYISDYLMLSAININHHQIEALDRVRYLDEFTFISENERTHIEEGDILFTIVGTLGRTCIYNGGLNISLQRSVSVIKTLIFNKYLQVVLDSPYIQNFMVANSTGTAQKGFYLNQVADLLIPVPPLKEQKRIVAKIEELLPLCRSLK